MKKKRNSDICVNKIGIHSIKIILKHLVIQLQHSDRFNHISSFFPLIIFVYTIQYLLERYKHFQNTKKRVGIHILGWVRTSFNASTWMHPVPWPLSLALCPLYPEYCTPYKRWLQQILGMSHSDYLHGVSETWVGSGVLLLLHFLYFRNTLSSISKSKSLREVLYPQTSRNLNGGYILHLKQL